MRYVRAVEDTKRVAVEAIRLSEKTRPSVGQLAKTAASAGGCKSLKLTGGADWDRTPDLRIAN